jgi:hypothetical protein
MSDSASDPRPDPPVSPVAARPNWRDVLGEGRAVYTLILNLGIGLHAIDVFIIATVMPAVVRDLGGAAYYAWSTMLYMVGTRGPDHTDSRPGGNLGWSDQSPMVTKN